MGFVGLLLACFLHKASSVRAKLRDILLTKMVANADDMDGEVRICRRQLQSIDDTWAIEHEYAMTVTGEGGKACT